MILKDEKTWVTWHKFGINLGYLYLGYFNTLYQGLVLIYGNPLSQSR